MMLHFENVRLGWSWAVAHWVVDWGFSPIPRKIGFLNSHYLECNLLTTRSLDSLSCTILRDSSSLAIMTRLDSTDAHLVSIMLYCSWYRWKMKQYGYNMRIYADKGHSDQDCEITIDLKCWKSRHASRIICTSCILECAWEGIHFNKFNKSYSCWAPLL